MIQIRKEVDEIVEGKQPKDNNVLKNAPHPAHVLALPDAEWNRYALLADRIESAAKPRRQALLSLHRCLSGFQPARKEVLAHNL
jgi:hypothetical protein